MPEICLYVGGYMCSQVYNFRTAVATPDVLWSLVPYISHLPPEAHGATVPAAA